MAVKFFVFVVELFDEYSVTIDLDDYWEEVNWIVGAYPTLDTAKEAAYLALVNYVNTDGNGGAGMAVYKIELGTNNKERVYSETAVGIGLVVEND